jgi:hypothetical protein
LLFWKLLWAVALALVLSATINSESLWTDEAFSAFIASHSSLTTTWATLRHGDSSDLQMVLYYLYLHVWSVVFGESEVALRSANIPFIVLYSGVLVWASDRLFHSRWVWAIAALAPLAVGFASDTRPYFDVIAVSLACATMLLVYLQSPSVRERKILPWLVIVAMMLGALFHMLMLLSGPPLLVVAGVFYIKDRDTLQWKDWKWPLMVLSPLGVVLMAYFAWTFGRGVAYDYAKPDILSMGSVVFRFVGLSGFAPNRHYDNPFRPYLFAMALSAGVFCAAIGALAVMRLRSDLNICFRALSLALLVGLAEMVVLSFVLHQQLEFRHLSSLLPLLLLLIMAGGYPAAPARWNLIAIAATVAIGVVWLVSDFRLLTSPEYQREDFKAAVRQCLKLQQNAVQDGWNAAIVVAADPIAPGYYGLSMDGEAPCFPMPDSCQQDLAEVPWPPKAKAQYALFWPVSRIRAYLERERERHSEVILLISKSRHPMLKDSAWWPVVSEMPDKEVYTQFGFFEYVLR